MNNKIKFIISILILFLILSCGWFRQKVEEKVNEKIDENLKKIDSSFSKGKIDSLIKQMDTLKLKSDSLSNKRGNKRSK